MKKKKAKMQKKRYPYNPNEWDESKSVEVNPEPRMKAGISTSIRLSHPMVIQLKKVANKKGGIGYQTLLKMWIAERLEKEAVGKK